MTIAINACSAHSGAGVAMLPQLLAALLRTEAAHRYVVFCAPRHAAMRTLAGPRVTVVVLRGVPAHPFLRILWEQLVFPWHLLRHRVDVLYSGGNTTSLLAPCRVVLLLENANPFSRIDLPYAHRERLRNWLLMALGWLSAWRATRIRFVSENSRRLIVPRLHVRASKCVVIPHGVAWRADERSHAQHADVPYLVTIGVNGPHRNTVRLIAAFALLVRTHGYDGRLVLVGYAGSSKHRALLQRAMDDAGIADRVELTGEVVHDRVRMYLASATALIFPSLEETFGIPLIEAMALGVPVVAADADCDPAYRGACFQPFREICGDAAVYCNPFDGADIARHMHDIITDTALRTQCIARGRQRAVQYTMDSTANALLRLFSDVA